MTRKEELKAMKAGVCTCSGRIVQATLGSAWARWNKNNDKQQIYGSVDDICMQCEACNKIYGMTYIHATGVELQQTDDDVKNFGAANGRA